MHNLKVSASLTCADLMHLKKEIDEINECDIDFIHYDVVDGSVNDCFCFGDSVLKAIRPYTLKPIEVHLAVEEVDKYIQPFVKAGADYIAVHYEYTKDVEEVIQKIRKFGAKPVLAFRADTPVPDDFIQYAKQVDWILKLTVKPGYAGQQMREETLEHIKEMRDQLNHHNLDIGIQADGNMNAQNITKVIEAGANIITGGSAGLYNNAGLRNSIRYIRSR